MADSYHKPRTKPDPFTLPPQATTINRSPFSCFPLPILVLGFDWLQRHSPHLNRSELYIESWSKNCLSSCVQSAIPPTPSLANSNEANPPGLSHMSKEYHLSLVFSKHKALTLPPHCPYDYAVDLLPGVPLPSSCLTSPVLKGRRWRHKLMNLWLLASSDTPQPYWGQGFSLWVRLFHQECIELGYESCIKMTIAITYLIYCQLGLHRR